MPSHCSRVARSLHHSPTSFISSSRHWEHSTTHLPPVNIAWRLNYTHTHTLTHIHTHRYSQWNFLQCWSGELTSNAGYSFIRMCAVLCLLLCVFLWPLSPLLYPSGHICSPEGVCVWWTANTPCFCHQALTVKPYLKCWNWCFLLMLWQMYLTLNQNQNLSGTLKRYVYYICFCVRFADDEWPWGWLPW